MKKSRHSDGQDEEAAENPPSLGEKVFHCCMIVLSLSIIFLISGGLFLLAWGRYGNKLIFEDTSGKLVIPIFCFGGFAGLGLFLYFYLRGPRDA